MAGNFLSSALATSRIRGSSTVTASGLTRAVLNALLLNAPGISFSNHAGSASPSSSGASRARRTVPVTVGHEIEVHAPDGADLRFISSDLQQEEVLVEHMSSSAAGDSAVPGLKVEPRGPNRVGIVVEKPAGSKSGHPHLSFHLPSRYLDVHVSAGKKSNISLNKLLESALHVKSEGGSVHLGTVSGSACSIDTKGGDFSAKSVQSPFSLSTVGGSASLQKLQGHKARVSTGTGPLSISSLYCQDFFASCGQLDGKNFHASNEAQVSTVASGGDVSIDGVDGRVTVCSNGGDVKLKLNKGARRVFVDSKHGDVTLLLDPALFARITYIGVGSLQHDLPLSALEEEGGQSSSSTLPPSSMSDSFQRKRQTLSVNGNSGRVSSSDFLEMQQQQPGSVLSRRSMAHLLENCSGGSSEEIAQADMAAKEGGGDVFDPCYCVIHIVSTTGNTLVKRAEDQGAGLGAIASFLPTELMATGTQAPSSSSSPSASA